MTALLWAAPVWVLGSLTGRLWLAALPAGGLRVRPWRLWFSAGSMRV